ncbi:UDP-N-acetylglucosamine--N-acetylmuramyl-(pentapeptide) pyrophosphoryl-undecaprenol N-acetylglucosamine transferase [Candidatus Parcubacteria bacterium]|jgi:UDP-N-acetylglucosamine--N-acetylmuramyl-(pentapeptide) pyrophosphoryl-undecaprenol N-acetylglucosamine transferase|nr:MAG: UDP-N-acetylglucosamine--N-acetylmuramyl-(pentapeptide) pyrophosphoryl-undecaprenol N-acetylglucosamine transferase [Candidatus Parcubacteria bacterium]
MKILLVGGGTLGSISPLLAIAQEISSRKPGIIFEFWGLAKNLEKQFVTEAGISYKTIPAGKFRRYFSFWNVTDVFKILFGFIVASIKLRQLRPNLILTAGSFVAVPVVWAAKRLGIPVFMYQQDVELGLANRLICRRANYKVAASEISAKAVPGGAEILGFALRQDLFSGQKVKVLEKYKLNPALPVLLLVGGSSGALALNKALLEALPKVSPRIQILHLTGQGKINPSPNRSGYVAIPFINRDFPDLLAAADLVISRAGSNALAEILALKKPVIIVPLPNSHQERNAEFLSSHGALVLTQASLTPDFFSEILNAYLLDRSKLEKLSQKLQGLWKFNGSQKIAEYILSKI